MVIQRIKRRLVRRTDVQRLVFCALEGREWVSVNELGDQIASLNGGVRIPAYVCDIAVSRLHRRAFIEMRHLKEGHATVIAVRARTDAHRQWRCGAPHWRSPLGTNGPHHE